MIIDWIAFVQVFGAALFASVFVVALYSLGIRFLATPKPAPRLADGSTAPNGPSRDAEDDDLEEDGRPAWATAGAYVCFGLSGVAVLIGIYLIVPALHG
ncbi:hypothetical protein FW756_01950 [Leucobacter sp. 1207-22]